MTASGEEGASVMHYGKQRLSQRSVGSQWPGTPGWEGVRYQASFGHSTGQKELKRGNMKKDNSYPNLKTCEAWIQSVRGGNGTHLRILFLPLDKGYIRQ